MIEVADFHKAYDSTIAVRGLTFAVSPGQILGLVGPNGAGKTTTLRALSGILQPTRGSLYVAGHDVVAEPVAAKQQLAYVPDDPQLFNDLTVDQHLAFAAGAYRVTDAAPRMAELLSQFQLQEKRQTRAGDLSRGMRQKLAVCCAYLHDPVAILFDEPLTGLDPLGIRYLKRSIVERAAAGSSVIVSSHLLAMVEDICTHLLILESGRQRFSGPLSSVHAASADSDGPLSLEDLFFRATAAEECSTEDPAHSAVATPSGAAD